MKVPTKKIGTLLTPAIHKIPAEIKTEIAVRKTRYG
jgi:hypothetical protein